MILFGGEIIVIVCGYGCGGCDVEFLLVLIVVLDGLFGVYVIVVDIDGIDGIEDNVGVIMILDIL